MQSKNVMQFREILEKSPELNVVTKYDIGIIGHGII